MDVLRHCVTYNEQECVVGSTVEDGCAYDEELITYQLCWEITDGLICQRERDTKQLHLQPLPNSQVESRADHISKISNLLPVYTFLKHEFF